MKPASDHFRPKKHVCIFEFECKTGALTGEVICRVCGVKAGPPKKASIEDEARPENERS